MLFMDYGVFDVSLQTMRGICVYNTSRRYGVELLLFFFASLYHRDSSLQQ